MNREKCWHSRSTAGLHSNVVWHSRCQNRDSSRLFTKLDGCRGECVHELWHRVKKLWTICHKTASRNCFGICVTSTLIRRNSSELLQVWCWRQSRSQDLILCWFEHAWRKFLLATTKIARPDDGSVANLSWAQMDVHMLSTSQEKSLDVRRFARGCGGRDILSFAWLYNSRRLCSSINEQKSIQHDHPRKHGLAGGSISSPIAIGEHCQRWARSALYLQLQPEVHRTTQISQKKFRRLSKQLQTATTTAQLVTTRVTWSVLKNSHNLAVCFVLFCRVLSCLVLSCLVLSCRVVSCRTVPCRAVPWSVW